LAALDGLGRKDWAAVRLRPFLAPRLQTVPWQEVKTYLMENVKDQLGEKLKFAVCAGCGFLSD
jgi:hypothetical protein